jgi:hypothetical protein
MVVDNLSSGQKSISLYDISKIQSGESNGSFIEEAIIGTNCGKNDFT